eukprot:GHVR01106380.1.p1 GENE.GHVR01106380.1~~GHVR01106380.1.p1  ORF type:complete len:213 (+),score=37.29 GHVR01106380.1:53-640(+)
MAPLQYDVYNEYLKTGQVAEARKKNNKNTGSIFKAISQMKKISLSPVLILPKRLWTWQSQSGYQLDDSDVSNMSDVSDVCDGKRDPHERRMVVGVMESIINAGQTPEELIEQGAKLMFASSHIPALISKGHKILIFSKFINTLNLIEYTILNPLQIKYERMDGKTPQADRTKAIASFESNENCRVFLLTTGVLTE